VRRRVPSTVRAQIDNHVHHSACMNQKASRERHARARASALKRPAAHAALHQAQAQDPAVPRGANARPRLSAAASHCAIAVQEICAVVDGGAVTLTGVSARGAAIAALDGGAVAVREAEAVCIRALCGYARHACEQLIRGRRAAALWPTHRASRRRPTRRSSASTASIRRCERTLRARR
jgi:hypothetical protein